METRFAATHFRFVRESEYNIEGWMLGNTIDVKTVDFQQSEITDNTGFILKGRIPRAPWGRQPPAPPVNPDDEEEEDGALALSAATLSLCVLSLAALI